MGWPTARRRLLPPAGPEGPRGRLRVVGALPCSKAVTSTPALPPPAPHSGNTASRQRSQGEGRHRADGSPAWESLPTGAVACQGPSSWEPKSPAGPLARVRTAGDRHAARPSCAQGQEGLGCCRVSADTGAHVLSRHPRCTGLQRALGVFSRVLCTRTSPLACRVRARPETRRSTCILPSGRAPQGGLLGVPRVCGTCAARERAVGLRTRAPAHRANSVALGASVAGGRGSPHWNPCAIPKGASCHPALH